MNKTIVSICLATASTFAVAGSNSHWDYSGKAGPKNWAKLSADNFACIGNNQSPINLTGFIEAELKPIEFNYAAGGNEVINNGHTIQVNYAKGSSINLDGQTFELKQFHFHAPSENHINGKSFPLEVHLVHASDKGELAVVALMFKEGKENPIIKKAWKGMPKKPGDKTGLYADIAVADLLPTNKSYYRFNGSLTTPPCSEGVRWLVMKDSVEVSKEQVEKFKHVLGHDTNRPIQAINARPVLQ